MMKDDLIWSQAAGGTPVTHGPSGAVIDFRPAGEWAEPPAVGTRTRAVGGVEYIGAPREIVDGVTPREWPRLMRIAGEMYFLYRAFGLRGEIGVMPGESEAVAYPGTTIIEADDDTLDHDLAEMYARAAMGERDILLATAWGAVESSEGMEEFWALTAPLRSAWAYGLMRRRIPDVYEREIEEIVGMMRETLGAEPGRPVIVPDDIALRRDALAMLAIIHENPATSAQVDLITRPESARAWDRYTQSLLDFARMEPDAELLCHLADAAMAPYRVSIERPAGDIPGYALETRT